MSRTRSPTRRSGTARRKGERFVQGKSSWMISHCGRVDLGYWPGLWTVIRPQLLVPVCTGSRGRHPPRSVKRAKGAISPHREGAAMATSLPVNLLQDLPLGMPRPAYAVFEPAQRSVNGVGR